MGSTCKYLLLLMTNYKNSVTHPCNGVMCTECASCDIGMTVYRKTYGNLGGS